MVLQRASRAVRGTTTLALGCWQLSCLARRASAPRQPTNLFVVKCDALGIILGWSRSFHFSQHIRKAWQRKKESGREPVCVPDVIGALPVWWQNTKKIKILQWTSLGNSKIDRVQFEPADHSEDHSEGHLVHSCSPDRSVPKCTAESTEEKTKKIGFWSTHEPNKLTGSRFV